MVVELTKAMERKGLDMRVSALVSLIGGSASIVSSEFGSGIFFYFILPNS